MGTREPGSNVSPPQNAPISTSASSSSSMGLVPHPDPPGPSTRPPQDLSPTLSSGHIHGSLNKTHHKPSSISEWQLFTVLDRANLLQYFDTFITQGGDDVQQLLEAGEEEFLEIMALVGMATKPLHVRRLQKTLQEFSVNPARFQLLTLQHQAAGSGTAIPVTLPLTAPGLFPPPIVPSAMFCVAPTSQLSPPAMSFPGMGLITTTTSRNRSTPSHHNPDDSPGPINDSRSLPTTTNGGLHPSWMSPPFPSPALGQGTANVMPGAEISSSMLPTGSGDGDYDSGVSGGGPTPSLSDIQILKLSECANEIVKSLPEYEPKLVQNKKKISKDLLMVMEMIPEDPSRLDEFRRYAAIYGRFDARRKPDKPLTLHEVSVNEAAAQICLLRPALLTRRDELFPLARQAVRDAGYNYAKGPNKGKFPDGEDFGEGSSSGRKRSTPAESVSSEGRSQTPSSSVGGTPPTGGALGTSAIESNLGMVASPSSSGTSGGHVPYKPMIGGLSAESSNRMDKYFVEFQGLDHYGRKRKLEDLGVELGRVVAEQEKAKRRVASTHDMGELMRIQSQLGQLTQRQMEISDRQAALIQLIEEEDKRSNRDERRMRRVGDEGHPSWRKYPRTDPGEWNKDIKREPEESDADPNVRSEFTQPSDTNPSRFTRGSRRDD